MIKVEVKRAIAIGNGMASKDLHPGIVYDLENQEMDGWYIPSLLKSGDMVILEDSRVPPPVVEFDFNDGKGIPAIDFNDGNNEEAIQAAHAIFDNEEIKLSPVQEEPVIIDPVEALAKKRNKSSDRAALLKEAKTEAAKPATKPRLNRSKVLS